MTAEDAEHGPDRTGDELPETLRPGAVRAARIRRALRQVEDRRRMRPALTGCAGRGTRSPSVPAAPRPGNAATPNAAAGPQGSGLVGALRSRTM